MHMNYTRGVPFIIFELSEAGVPDRCTLRKGDRFEFLSSLFNTSFHFVTFCTIGGVRKVRKKDTFADWLILGLVSVLRI